MKIAITIIILFISFRSFSQLTLDRNTDLTYTYYRSLGISFASSVILEHITRRPFTAGVTGLAIGSLQGLILEKGGTSKIVSCMGSFGGSFVYVVRCDIKNKKQQKKLNKAKEENGEK